MLKSIKLFSFFAVCISMLSFVHIAYASANTPGNYILENARSSIYDEDTLFEVDLRSDMEYRMDRLVDGSQVSTLLYAYYISDKPIPRYDTNEGFITYEHIPLDIILGNNAEKFIYEPSLGPIHMTIDLEPPVGWSFNYNSAYFATNPGRIFNLSDFSLQANIKYSTRMLENEMIAHDFEIIYKSNTEIVGNTKYSSTRPLNGPAQPLQVVSGSPVKFYLTTSGHNEPSDYVPHPDSQKEQWLQDAQGWWYRNADGSYTKNNWQNIDNTWYYFNATGYMVTGWQQISGTWYYLAASGAMTTGWQQIGGTWYYLAPSGAMTTGWQQIGGTWYYLAPSGAMTTGWQQIGGTWYYLAPSGAMTTGWQQVGETWYYLNSSGSMLTGWQTISEQSYFLNASGAWIPNS